MSYVQYIPKAVQALPVFVAVNKTAQFSTKMAVLIVVQKPTAPPRFFAQNRTGFLKVKVKLQYRKRCFPTTALMTLRRAAAADFKFPWNQSFQEHPKHISTDKFLGLTTWATLRYWEFGQARFNVPLDTNVILKMVLFQSVSSCQTS